MITYRLKSVILLLLSSLLLVSCGFNAPSQFEIEQTVLEFKHQPAENIFKRASESYRNKEYTFAIAQYSALAKLYPASQYTQLARMALIDCYQVNGQMIQAIDAASEFIQLHPDSQHINKVKAIKRDLKDKQHSINNYDIFGLYSSLGGFTPYGYGLACTVLPLIFFPAALLPPVLLIRFFFFV